MYQCLHFSPLANQSLRHSQIANVLLLDLQNLKTDAPASLGNAFPRAPDRQTLFAETSTNRYTFRNNLVPFLRCFLDISSVCRADYGCMANPCRIRT